jgi:hypothetical protein
MYMQGKLKIKRITYTVLFTNFSTHIKYCRIRIDIEMLPSATLHKTELNMDHNYRYCIRIFYRALKQVFYKIFAERTDEAGEKIIYSPTPADCRFSFRWKLIDRLWQVG